MADMVRGGLLEEEKVELDIKYDWNEKGPLGGRKNADKCLESGSVRHVQDTGLRRAWLVGKSKK